MEGIKKFDKEGFIVFDTPIGDIVIALPDSRLECADSFTLSTETDDEGKTIEIKINFTEKV